MSHASEARRLAIRLVDALKCEGHDCTIEIDEAGMPTINIVETVCPAVRYITFDIEIGDVAGRLGE